MKTSRLLWALPISMFATHAPAQEPAAPPPYFLLVESAVAEEDAADWAEALAMTSRAHAEHPEGNTWATYRKLTGGPDETLRTFFALEQMGDLDGWKSNHQIVMEALGKNRARVVLSDLELESASRERILSYSAKLSHPAAGFHPAKYYWTVEVVVENGKMSEYAALARRLIESRKSTDAGAFLVYGNALGGDNSALTYLFGFDRFAEIDAWPSRLAMASETLGDEEAERLLAAIEAISSTTSSLWQLEPRLSQLEAK